MVPSIAGLIQGIGKDEGCRNVSMNKSVNKIEYNLEQIPLEPLFSVSYYYIFLMFVLSICLFAIILINRLALSLKCRKNLLKSQQVELEDLSDAFQNMNSDSNAIDLNSNEIPTIREQYFLLSLIFLITFIGF